MNALLPFRRSALLLLAALVPLTGLRADKLEDERLEQTGTAITIIFDDSGSMAGSKMDQAKTAFRNWLSGVPPQHRLSLIALNAGRIVPFGRGNNAEVLAAVSRLKAAGGTPLVATIDRALADIAKRRQEVGPYERQILIVFTDGQESSNIGNRGVQDRLRKVREANIEAVGIGFAGEGDYMANFATRYSNANDAAQLQAVLSKVDVEIGDTSDIRISPEVLALMASASPPGQQSFPATLGSEARGADGALASTPPAATAPTTATANPPAASPVGTGAPAAAPAQAAPGRGIPIWAGAVGFVALLLVVRVFSRMGGGKKR